MESGNRPSGMSLGLFAGAVVLGGSNFLAVRFSNRDLEPFWGAALRFTLAAILFVGIALALRLRWPRGRQLFDTLVLGLLSFALFYALMYWALVRVTAGMATVILAIVPLITLLLAAAHGMERLQPRAMTGSLLALAGILWMTITSSEVTIPRTALLAMLGAALCVGESVILSKRLSGNHPVITNAVAMSAGAAILLALSAVAGETWVLPRQAEAVWAIAYLVTLGSVGLFVLVLLVVRHWTASASSYMFVLFPLVTLVLGAVLADEPVTVQAVTGAALVMAGVWFGALSPGARPMAESEVMEAVPEPTG